MPEESFEEWAAPRTPVGKERNGEEWTVRIVRPLRDTSMKECAAWAYWKEVEIPGKATRPDGTAKQSIGNLTKSESLMFDYSPDGAFADTSFPSRLYYRP